MSLFAINDIQFLLRDLKRKWGPSIFKVLLAVLCAGVSVQFYLTTAGQKLDLALQHPFYALRGERTPPREVILVAVDDAAYVALNAPTSFPLPRKYIAEAFEQIATAGPRLMIIDARIEPQPGLAPEADDRIEAAMRRMPTTIWSGKEAVDPNDPTTLIAVPSENRFRNAAKAELPMTVAGIDGELCYIAWGRAGESSEQRIPLHKTLTEIAHLSLNGVPAFNEFINFYGPHLTIPRMSLYELITGDVEAARAKLKDKIVLFGYQSRNFGKGPGNSDRFSVPVSNLPMYGIEIHANLVSNLIDSSWIKRQKLVNEVLFVALLVFLMVSYALRYPNWRSVAIIIVVLSGATIAAFFTFAKYNFWLGGTGTALLAGVLTVIISGFYFIIARDKFNRLAEKKLGFKISEE